MPLKFHAGDKFPETTFTDENGQAVPLADMAWVILLRWRAGQPFYMGDTNHFSHRLVRRGLSRTRAVLVIWLLTAATGALAFLR